MRPKPLFALLGLALVVVTSGCTGNEFATRDRAQTDADRLPATTPVALLSEVEAASTRFLGTVDGQDLYFATAVDNGNYCIVRAGEHAQASCSPQLPIVLGFDSGDIALAARQPAENWAAVGESLWQQQ